LSTNVNFASKSVTAAMAAILPPARTNATANAPGLHLACNRCASRRPPLQLPQRDGWPYATPTIRSWATGSSIMHARTIGFAILATIAAAPAAAAPTYYTDAAAFAAAVNGPIHLESFENPSFEGFNIQAYDRFTMSNMAGLARGGYQPSDGVAALQTNHGDLPVSATFYAPISAFGIDVIGLGTVLPTQFYFETGSGDYAFPDIYIEYFSEVHFFGVIDPDGFTQVAFHGLVWEDISFDLARSVDYVAPMPGAVPEPASWAMLIAGFGIIGAAQRRRRNVSHIVA
jgi:hypothetical protein